jgi:hypothetical protein
MGRLSLFLWPVPGRLEFLFSFHFNVFKRKNKKVSKGIKESPLEASTRDFLETPFHNLLQKVKVGLLG